MSLSQIFFRLTACIGNKGFYLYAISALLLMLPSMRLWLEPVWVIVPFEFDFWVGLFPSEAPLRNSPFFILGNTIQTMLFIMAGLGFAAFAMEIEQENKHAFSRKLKIRIFILVLIFCLGIPWFSVDCFYYLAKGWQEAAYGLDVYQQPFSVIPYFEKDVFFQNVYPGFIHCLGSYGPLFQAFIKTICENGFGNFAFTFILLRLSFLGALLGSCWFVLQIAKRVELSGALAILLFIGSPLMLFNSLTVVHNDVVVNLFVLAAIYFACDNKALVAGACLGLGAAWKFIPLLLFPVFVLYFFRCNAKVSWRQPALFMLGLVSLFGTSFLLYPSSFHFFTSVAAAGLSTMRASIFFYIYPLIALTWGSEHAFNTSKQIVTILFLVTSTLILWPYLWGKRIMRPQNLIVVCYLVFLTYLVVGTSQVQEWYLTWLLALGCLIPHPKLRLFNMILAVFYMPWVSYLCSGSAMVIIISNVVTYTAFAWAAVRLLAVPLFRSSDMRDELLGARTVSKKRDTSEI